MVPKGSCALRLRLVSVSGFTAFSMAETIAQAIEENVNHRCGVKRQHLADEESSDHGDAQRAAQLRPVAASQRKGNATEQCRHRGHHDWPEAKQAGLVDGIGRAFALLA